jgi:hypothetical protein
MKLTKVHLFVMLLLALVFCSFLGGACGGGGGLEGFNMPSDTSPYRGKGQYSDQFSSYGDMYSDNKQFAKQQDAINNRKDKPAAPDYNPDYTPSNPGDDDADSKFAPFSAAGSSAAGSSAAGSSAAGSSAAGSSAAGSSAAGSSAAGSSAAGIPSSQIIPGQEDLYILKSSVVPPVCPACPAVRCNTSGNGSSGNGKNSTPAKCPPCPPCARCPEPSFECKKVPNYNLSNNNALPRPVLSSFSQFGL